MDVERLRWCRWECNNSCCPFSLLFWPYLIVVWVSPEFRKLSLDAMVEKDKLLMIKSLKQKDNVVGFIGGWMTRDTPVLQEADICDIVLTSGNTFSSLNTILESGGQEYKKIQKFIQIQIISNISALLITAVETICLGESSTTILQVLYLNLVLAVLGGLMLVMKLRHKELSNNQVGKRNKSIITKLMRINILVQVSYQVFIFLMFHFKGEALHIPSMNPMNPWFKVAVIDSKGPEAYRSRYIDLVSTIRKIS
ncbi:hypothetical protein AAG906_040178 [Vitis piasezkii]